MLEDMAYALSVVDNIEAGLADSEADRVMDTTGLHRHFKLGE